VEIVIFSIIAPIASVVGAAIVNVLTPGRSRARRIAAKHIGAIIYIAYIHSEIIARVVPGVLHDSCPVVIPAALCGYLKYAVHVLVFSIACLS
jgi:hypothetical protein